MRRKNCQKTIIVAIAVLTLVFLAGPVQARVSLTDLQNQITALQDDVTDLQADIGALETVDTGLQAQINSLQAQIDGLQGQIDRNGKKVGPGLYEVHVKTLWDVGWISTGNFPYTPNAKGLNWYGGSSFYLSPLSAYGVPGVQPGATRKVRLYANYSHQMGCSGNPVVNVGSAQFVFGAHHGSQADMGAGWSSWVEGAAIPSGHQSISVAFINWGGGWYCPSATSTVGYIHKVVAHFYDQFPSE